MTVLTDARVLTPAGVLPGAWIEVGGRSITAIGDGRPPSGLAVSLDGAWVLPGFVDIHVHGGGGHDITSGHPDEALAAVEFHQRHGTTSTLLSLVTSPIDDLLAATRRLGDLVDRRRRAGGGHTQIVGVHLEGPFLATCRCGAQDPDHLLEPDPELMATLLDAGRGAVRMVTLAPELAGGLDLVRQLTERGVVAALGHSDATHAQGLAAFQAGARVATHLFNGMRPFAHREPGVAGAALDSPDVVCELIVDDAHLHRATVRTATAVKTVDGIALVTDAIAAAGSPDGAYRLGRLDVEVADGVARLAGDEPAELRSLAGSTLTMDRALRTAIDAGLSLAAASTAASLTPARVLGIGHRTGSLEVGKDADLVVLDETFVVDSVVARGELARAGARLVDLPGTTD